MRLIFAVVAAGGLLLDQLTKIIAVRWLDPADPPVLLGGLLTLRLIRNPGAAFSLGESFTIVFALLAVAVVTFVLVKLAPKVNHPGWAVALGLLVAGVSGNLMDRIFRTPSVLRGHVVDFFQLPHFAIFNIADVCITSAAALIMILAVIKNVGIEGEHYTRDTVAAGGGERPSDPRAQAPQATEGAVANEGAEATEDAAERPDRES
jgi:signal peptidase II